MTVYVERLDAKLRSEILEKARLVSFFLVRTATPRLSDLERKRVAWDPVRGCAVFLGEYAYG